MQSQGRKNRQEHIVEQKQEITQIKSQPSGRGHTIIGLGGVPNKLEDPTNTNTTSRIPNNTAILKDVAGTTQATPRRWILGCHKFKN